MSRMRISPDHSALAGDRHNFARRFIGAVGEQRLIAGVVHRRADVVRHAAVHGDAAAHAGDVLRSSRPCIARRWRATSERPGSTKRRSGGSA
jgi:hypothetical protein